MRLTILLLLLLAGGCGSPKEQEEGAGHSSVPPPPLLAEEEESDAPERLAGEYRVAGIDGRPLAASFGIAVSIDAGTISFDPRCAGFVWTYQYRAGELSTQRPSGPAQAVCEIAVPPELTQLATALDSAKRAERTPANGIELSGGGRSVTLFSQ